MTKEEKAKYVDDLAVQLAENNVIYLTDTAELTVEVVGNLRRKAFNANVSMRVVKNSLLEKAMDRVEDKDFGELRDTLKGATSIMFAETGNGPARLIKDFRKKEDKPILKGAYIDASVYVGDDQLTMLSELKSKEEMIGEIIGLLQSPAKNVVSGLKGAGGKLAGILKTLEERA
ncbi:MAG: 50S ribosomal protein L10 [Crocinitomicaceae bacterium]|jgi:large subunit ribosomal protein L10|nr:50S ribosomal protein L10 [Crocinitomicaceae bacterium]MDG1659036.1 50S ribosomal protein L10 [Crocinitomicaceae bacterium]|tara:strand:- start:2894 stop:3415 length:522 start_codon:yes stop_codon:yes gene_type:complete